MKHLWTWLAHESTTDHLALVVSALAFVVAVWAGYQAKRSASAAENKREWLLTSYSKAWEPATLLRRLPKKLKL